MSRHLLTLALVAATALPIAAQNAPPVAPAAPAAPRFEVASIRVSPEPGPGSRGGLTITRQQARFSLLSLNDYIGIAFSVKLHQISGPDWLASTRFEIAATIPETSKPDQLSPMMRTLLEERFKLRTHKESREFPVYSLEAAPGAKLVRLPDDKPTDGPFTVTGGGNAGGAAVDLGNGSSLLLGNNRFEAKKVTMAALADILARFVDRPVVDGTGLQGSYDVAFELQPDDFVAMMIRSAVAAGASLPPQALQRLDTASPAAVPDALKAVGLLLTPKRAPLEVLVIDSMEKLPTEN
jgi:uncharacterized protein (TIGR03435 family)